MQNKQEELFGNARFINNEKEIAQLQNSGESNPYKIIPLCQENINFIKNLISSVEHEEVPNESLIFGEVLDKLSGYYLSMFKALCAIKNPTEHDELDRLKYRTLAQECHPEEVKQIEIELERIRFDADYSLALFLNDVENEAPQIYPRQRFFKLEPSEGNSNVDLEHHKGVDFSM